MSLGQSAKQRVCTFIVATSLHMAAAAAAPDVVALTYINGLPFVAVTVGAATTRLMVDSGGALGISIPEATVAKAGSVTLLAHKTRFHDLGGKVFEVQDLIAERVVVGTTRLAKVNGRIHTQWGGAPEGADAELTKAREAGAIGLAAFGEHALMFDYRQRTLSIFAPGDGPQAGQAGWHMLRLDYGKEGPTVSLVVGGKPLKFVLDTGSPVNLVNRDALAASSAPVSCAHPDAPGQDCDPRLLADVRDADGRSLGALMAERVTLGGAPFDGLLGAPFFAERRVLFDLSGHRLLIAPADAGTGHAQ